MFRYSLSDAPNPQYFRVSVKPEPGIRVVAPSGTLDTTQAAHPGWISNLLHATLVEGDPIDAAFLFGEFFLNDSSAPVVLLSASVGLTPLLAMFNTLVKTDFQREVSWVGAWET